MPTTRRRRIEIPRRVGENDDHYRVSVWGIWPDSVGEEDRDSLDAGAGETAEERGIPATTTCHRSSGANERFNDWGGRGYDDSIPG